MKSTDVSTVVILTVPEVASLLKVHPQTVYLWASSPEMSMPCFRLGSAIRFDRSDVIAWAKRMGGRHA